jgi:hypothetical protein
MGVKTPLRHRGFHFWSGLLVSILSLATVGMCARADEATVYSDSVLSRWSDPAVAANSTGKPFRGPFRNQPVTLTLDGLPTHAWVKVRFDLYMVGTWDGSNPVWGPDLWSLSVRGGQRLIFASFCGWGYAGNDEQSYPDDYPIATYPAWTGVSQRGIFPSEAPNLAKNGVYKVEVVFPHSQSQLILDFAGIYQDPELEQQWGIGNLETSTLTEAPTQDPSVLPKLWEDLASENGVKANAALWRFVGAGDRAIDFIAEKVKAARNTPEMATSSSPTDGLRWHRAHRIARIIGGPKTSDLCFSMDSLLPEYLKKYGAEK